MNSGYTPHGKASDLSEYYEPGLWPISTTPDLKPWTIPSREEDSRPQVLVVPACRDDEPPHPGKLVPVPLIAMEQEHGYEIVDGYVVATGFRYDLFAMPDQRLPLLLRGTAGEGAPA